MQKNFSGIKMGNGKKNFLVQKWEMRVVHGCAVVKKNLPRENRGQLRRSNFQATETTV